MYAISIRQPWLWAICRGGKTVENRANKRGPVAAVKQFRAAAGYDVLLHASSRWEGEETFRVVRHLSPVDPGTPGGPRSDTAWFGDSGFVAIARVSGVHSWEACYDIVTGRLCSPWAEEHAAHLTLTNVRVLHRPVPYKGSLGLFNVDDALVLAQVRRQAE